MDKIGIWLRKNQINQTKPKTKSAKLSKKTGSSYFCALSLYAEFQFPRFCLSWISSQDSYMGDENQTNQLKPKLKQTKPSKTPWFILFLWVEPKCRISASKVCVSYISTQDSSMTEKTQTNQTKNPWITLFLWVEYVC